ncbi:hypothetical protein M422DRAFT_26740 [Sphaerobolus stellatus SS14]|nr:hypothetical protein M422DRAFT_26740 [Sphaerobolus stellatus SS14]
MVKVNFLTAATCKAMFSRQLFATTKDRVFRRTYSKISSSPRSVLFVKKKHDTAVSEAMASIIKYLKNAHPSVRLMQDSPFDTVLGIPKDYVEPWAPHCKEPIDLVVTLGGDGTILRASSLFRTGPVPPVLSFSMGTLGFLLPFHIHDFREALDEVFKCNVTILERMRLSCTFHDSDGKQFGLAGEAGWQAMNEVTLHRGRSPHLNIVDIFVDGVHLTEAYSDGLIISSPTGSTAYSLSAGGPIVHPSVQALLVTPISPRSLSFRPLLLPGNSHIKLQINPKSRASAEVAMDGQEPSPTLASLSPGQSVSVEVSSYPIPCIERSPSKMEDTRGSRSDDWVKDINTLLQFNATFRNKGILRHTR